MRILYTAEATTTGGRAGHIRSSDGNLEAALAVPQEMGGPGGAGTNPEQLFAAGYAACFENAMLSVARRQHQTIEQSEVTARVGIGPTAGGTYGLAVALHIRLPDMDRAAAEALVEQAHQRCPYSNAVRGNIDVQLVIEEPPAR